MGLWNWLFGSASKAELEPKPGNTPPCYYGYRGGWDNVTICRDCGLKGLYEDNHPTNPCHACGGKRDEAIGIWRGTEWEVKPGSLKKRVW